MAKSLRAAVVFFAVGMIIAAVGCLIARSVYTSQDKQFEDWVLQECYIESYHVRSSRMGKKCEANTLVNYSMGVNSTCSGVYLVAPKFLETGKVDDATMSSCNFEDVEITECTAPVGECKNPIEGSSNEPFCTTDTANGKPRDCAELLNVSITLICVGVVFLVLFTFDKLLQLCSCNFFRQWQLLGNPWQSSGAYGTYRFCLEEFEQLQGVFECGDTRKVVSLKRGADKVTEDAELLVVTTTGGQDSVISFKHGVISHEKHRLVYNDDLDNPMWQDENLGRVNWKRSNKEMKIERLPSYADATGSREPSAPPSPETE